MANPEKLGPTKAEENSINMMFLDAACKGRCKTQNRLLRPSKEKRRTQRSRITHRWGTEISRRHLRGDSPIRIVSKKN